eukprot:TRINITY_DN71199_c0_g1_i1.p1 TRINITY_DN71199_c0_g1~~TRINITY_DN71199_c0_g1_i1.p1  ORF type:complete len:365 (+),score=81.15 TRINITY_DN71199_c0_g1_i1:80-1096(+)
MRAVGCATLAALAAPFPRLAAAQWTSFGSGKCVDSKGNTFDEFYQNFFSGGSSGCKSACKAEPKCVGIIWETSPNVVCNLLASNNDDIIRNGFFSNTQQHKDSMGSTGVGHPAGSDGCCGGRKTCYGLAAPTGFPRAPPTQSPRKHPTRSPTSGPTVQPSRSPTRAPRDPTAAPDRPTGSPTWAPTGSPELPPTRAPLGPTRSPAAPTRPPSGAPTSAPFAAPTGAPLLPTAAPLAPTAAPLAPTAAPVPPVRQAGNLTAEEDDDSSSPLLWALLGGGAACIAGGMVAAFAVRRHREQPKQKFGEQLDTLEEMEYNNLSVQDMPASASGSPTSAPPAL